jgi:hypothetical protein
MRKYELATALFISSLVLLSSILATIYGVYPFEEYRPVSEWVGFLTGDYPETQIYPSMHD